MLFSASSDKMIIIWKTESKEKIGTLKGHSGSVYTLKQGKDPNILFSGGYDNKIIKWNISKKTIISEFDGFYTYLTCMSISNNDRFLYSINSKNCNFIKYFNKKKS